MSARTPVSNDTVDVENRIHTTRGMRVILGRDLAEIYGVETKQIKRAVSRNKHRFPDDFAFVLAHEEVTNLRYRNGASSSGWGGREEHTRTRQPSTATREQAKRKPGQTPKTQTSDKGRH